ncbi:MAG TPA: hypothetical protein VHB68_11150 [Steroidobacteraceae bacterium]|nr:hypothetical protein [Steroidobacteraceae bacterium]
MSSSCHNGARRRGRRGIALGGAACVVVSVGQPALALEYFVPRVEATGEYDSNINMDPTNTKAYGYGGLAMADIGWITQTSDTAIRPYFNYMRYPDQQGIYELDSRVDLRWLFNTQRSQFSLYGRFDREDTTYAELSSALYNPLDPNVRPNADTGYVQEGVIRTLGYAAPSWSYRMTQRLSFTTDLYYLHESYNDTGSTAVENALNGFNYYSATVSLQQRLTETSTLKYGGYFARFDSGGVARTNGYGLKVEYNRKWTQRLSLLLSGNAERDKTDETYPVVFNGSTTQWGAAAGLVYQGEISTTRLTVDRILSPSGAGAMIASNEMWLQYDRRWTERLKFIGALRYIHDGAVGESANLFPVRNYTRAYVEARYMVTPTWYFRVDYEYTWQGFHGEPSAANNGVSIGFGYQALKPPGVP